MPDATVDAPYVVPDGCVEPSAGDPTAIGAVMNIGSTELSGLAISHTIPDLLWTHGDSGGAAVVYSIGASSAAVHGTLKLKDVTAIDWEDIATASCGSSRCIFIADTGDNNLDRKTVSIYQIEEPTSNPVGTVTVDAQRYDMKYDDGAHNVESLFVDPRDGRSYVITKVQSPAASVYELTRTAGETTTATKVTTLSIPSSDPRVTAADMFVDQCAARILIRSHDALYQLRGTPDSSVATLLAGPLIPMPVAPEPQGEAVAWAADGSAYWTTSEGANPTLYRTSY